MIRVNLLAAATGPAAAPARQWFPKEQRSAAMGLALLVVSGVGTGGYWWYLSSQRASVERQITQGEDELVRLKQAADLVAKAQARKAELTERLNLIERLRSAKRAPVTLLETLSSATPEGLWLIELKQTGTRIQMLSTSCDARGGTGRAGAGMAGRDTLISLRGSNAGCPRSMRFRPSAFGTS